MENVNKITMLIFFLVSVTLGIGLMLFLNLFENDTLVEPHPLGILIEEVENNSDTPVTIVNPFSYDFFTIQPHETKKLETWLPNVNFKIERSKKVIQRGTIGHPDNRFLLLHTKLGLMKIIVGKSYNFKDGYAPDTRIWVVFDGGQSYKPIKGMNLVNNNDDLAKKLVIDTDGTPYIKGAQTKEDLVSSGAMSDFEQYKFSLAKSRGKKQLPRFLQN